MKKTMKLFSVILMVVMMSTVFATTVFATTPGSIAEGLTGTYDDKTTSSVTSIGNKVIGVVTTVGVVVAVVVLLVLGIKYMIGSASEKAEYKKTMIPYVVGAVLIFGASAITKVVISLGTGLTTV